MPGAALHVYTSARCEPLGSLSMKGLFPLQGEDNVIICSHCGRENEDHYKFCLGCGSPLSKPEAPEMIPCPNCATPVPSNFKFCGACGTPIPQGGDLSPASGAAGGLSASRAEAAPPLSSEKPAPAEPAPLSVSRSPALHSTDPSGAPAAKKSSAASSGADAAAGMFDASPSTGSNVARLVVIRPDGSEGATIPLREGEVVVGRNSEHQVLANDPFLSPRHARISCRQGQFSIEDIDSLNGVFFRIKSEHELASGDYIRLGQELLQFHRMEDVNASVPALSADDSQRGGSPDVGYWGRLSLVSGPDLVSRAFAFSDDEVNIGREFGDIVFRDDGFVSGRHARIAKVDHRIVLKDLGSSNGTYVRIKKPVTLHNGDLILMGQQLFRLMS